MCCQESKARERTWASRWESKLPAMIGSASRALAAGPGTVLLISIQSEVTISQSAYPYPNPIFTLTLVRVETLLLPNWNPRARST